MAGQATRRPRGERERGQASIVLLGVVAALLLGVAVLAAFGQALAAKGRHQRAADLAAVSAARVMRDAYPRLFESALLRRGVPNPRHLPVSDYLALARRAALRAGRRNGVVLRAGDVRFPADSFAPTRVTVLARGVVRVRVDGGDAGRSRAVRVRARATAEIAPAAEAALDFAAHGSGGGYDGPLAYRMGKAMRPDVAEAFDRMAAAARREAGLSLSITSAFRSDAEQARLFAANPNPKWVAPPGTSLHRYATELDLGPPAAYGWLKQNARRFGFIHRYAWEPWHYELPLALYRPSVRRSDRAYEARPPPSLIAQVGGQARVSRPSSRRLPSPFGFRHPRARPATIRRCSQ